MARERQRLEATIGIGDVIGEPTVVMDVEVALESETMSADQGNGNSVLELREVFLRMNPSFGKMG